jgi:hypothetical protein
VTSAFGIDTRRSADPRQSTDTTSPPDVVPIDLQQHCPTIDTDSLPSAETAAPTSVAHAVQRDGSRARDPRGPPETTGARGRPGDSLTAAGDDRFGARNLAGDFVGVVRWDDRIEGEDEPGS